MPNLEYTRIPEANVYQCNDCGAYAEDPREVEHHATYTPGESKKWEQIYEEGEEES